MKISIIGAGYSSLVLAYLLKKKNHEISIFETKNYCGGILNDYFQNGELFLRGCQYLEPERNWFPEIINELKSEVKSINHIYGSYTSFKDKEIISNDIPVPNLNSSNNFFFENLNEKILSIADKVNCYPKDIRKKLNFFYKKYNLNLNDVYHGSSEPLGILRVALKYDQKKIDFLKKNKKIDDLLATKNKNIGTKKMIAYIPKYGYTNLFRYFCSILIKKKINIFLNNPIIPRWHNHKLKIYDKKNNEIETDYVIWTGNPTNLLSKYNGKKLDSITTTIYQLNALLENNINMDDRYINIFSDKNDLSRIFLYKTNCNKILVESTDKKFDKKKISTIHSIINKFGMKNKIIINSMNIKKDIRFNIISCKDKVTLSDFNFKTSNTNLIHCEWHTYGRNKRINSFINNLKIKNLL